MRVLRQVEGKPGFWVQRGRQGAIILRDLRGQRTPVKSVGAGGRPGGLLEGLRGLWGREEVF